MFNCLHVNKKQSGDLLTMQPPLLIFIVVCMCGLLTINLIEMGQIYYWIGLVVFWLSAMIGSVISIGFLVKKILDELGRRFKIMWIMVEFSYYRKEFKEWVKDKKRHPKCES